VISSVLPSNFVRLLLLCTVGYFALASHGHGRSSPGAPSALASTTRDTLHLYVPQSPFSLNPLLATDAYEQQLSYLAYDSLVVPDAEDHVRPGLATVVPSVANGGISRDGKTVTFKLRKGVRWQDGQPCTSADVAFTFAKITDPKVDVPLRTGYDRIADVATPDSCTVVATLREMFAPFVSYAGYQYPIVPKHLLDKSADFNRDPIGTHPVGTGPYRFKRWEHAAASNTSRTMRISRDRRKSRTSRS
jgi:peptide/nickel transport system substrate-binding protein